MCRSRSVKHTVVVERISHDRDPELYLKQVFRSSKGQCTACQHHLTVHLCDWYVVKAKIGTTANDSILQSLEWAMAARLRLSGWQHPATWEVMHCKLAMQLLYAQNSPASQELICRIISAQVGVLGSQHEQVMLSQQVLAHLLLQERKFEESGRLVAITYQYLIRCDGRAARALHLRAACAMNLSIMRYSDKVRHTTHDEPSLRLRSIVCVPIHK